MNDIIYCIGGASGSGKTTVAKSLHDEGYNVIQSYTTRPPREVGEWGHTFVDETEEDPHKWPAGVIAHNIFNGFRYWATKEQYFGKCKTIYVIDPIGVEHLRKTIDEPIVVITLYASERVLVERMCVERGGREALQRRKHDRKVFACVPTDWVIDTDQTKGQVLKNVKNIIEGKV